MEGARLLAIDFGRVETPAFVVDLGQLRRNLECLAVVQERAGCKILLALKAFAMWKTFPLVRQYLSGVAASSPDEARLGREEFGGEVHTYAPAYSEASLLEILELSDHVIFNSPAQWRHFRQLVSERAPQVRCGLRINPEHSEVAVPLYDPCAPGSRLGSTRAAIDADPGALDGLTGVHLHTLCELGADALERTLAVVEERFGDLLERADWVNLGGGHHITRPDYDIDLLVELIARLRERYRVEVILEPGEAIAIRTGVLVASVLDRIRNREEIAILDVSATAHMPDTLEMPYRPDVLGAGMPGTRAHDVRLGGLSCLAGDVVGDYSFDRPLAIGDRVVFLDMTHYTMVKTTNFNGVRLPSIATYDPDTDRIEVLKRFDYSSYRDRLS